MNSRLECLQPLPRDYLADLARVAPGCVTVVYLHGSLALEAPRFLKKIIRTGSATALSASGKVAA